MPDKNIYGIFKYFIHNFDTYHLSTRQLMKLCYKAEIRSIDKYGERLTNLTFTRRDFGPICHELYDFVREGDPDVDIFEETFGDDKHGRVFMPNRINISIPLRPKTKEILDEIITEWQNEAPETIIGSTKFMPPYTWTDKKSPIEFDRFIEHRNNIYLNIDLGKTIKDNYKDIEDENGLTFDSYQKFNEHLFNS